MKTRVLLIVFFVVAFFAPGNAQLREVGNVPSPSAVGGNSFRDIDKEVRRTEERSAIKQEKRVATPTKKVEADTVYSLMIVKRDGWFEPRGILTKAQTKHLARYFRFTGRNKGGHWSRIESVNSSGQYVQSGIEPYILKLYSAIDTNTNNVWRERMLTGCILEMIGDVKGENLVQERAYDANHNLLYSFTPVSQGNNVFVGTYKDIYGLPAEMRTEPGYSYGTLVRITRDGNGFERIIEFLDSKGEHKPNSDDAYATEYIYDDDGLLQSQLSIDEDGNYMIDNAQNCGNLLEWDKEKSLLKSVVNVDEKLRPVRIRGEETGMFNGVIKQLYEYDDNKRQSSITFVDEDNNPAINNHGMHRVESTYDNFGNMLSMTGKSLTGSLMPLDNSGVAKKTMSYDSLGRITETRLYNLFEEPISKDKGPWRVVTTYSPDGSMASYIGYVKSGDGEEVYAGFKNERHDDGSVTLTNISTDGVTWVQNYDALGRGLSDEVTDREGKPFDPSRGFASFRANYEEKDGKTVMTELWFDAENKPTVFNQMGTGIKIDKRVSEGDTVKGLIYVKGYRDGKLVDSFIKRIDSKGLLQGQYDVNRFGTPARGGSSSGIRYYNADAHYSRFGEISSLVGKDEFNEPDYVVPLSGLPYAYQRTTKTGLEFKMEDDSTVTYEDVGNIRNELPKGIEIEITDSIAYGYGLRDGDIVLKYGKFSSISSDMEGWEEDLLGNWVVNNVLEAAQPREMIVFRVEDGEAGKYGIVKLDRLPAGSAKQLGFVPHLRFLTQRQKERILDCVKDNPEYKDLFEYDFLDGLDRLDSDKYVIVDFPTLYSVEKDNFYPREVGEPALLLGIYDEDRDLEWLPGELSVVEPLNLGAYGIMPLDATSPRRNYYFTADGKHIYEAQLDVPQGDFQFYEYLVKKEEYDALKHLFKEAESRIRQIKKTKPAFAKKKIEGYWKTEDSHNVYATQGYINFEKDGTCTGELTGYTVIPDGVFSNTPGEMRFRKKVDLDGTWDTDGKGMIIFYPDNEAEYVCVNYNLAPVMQNSMMPHNEEQRRMESMGYAAYINEYLHQNPSVFVLNMQTGDTIDRFAKIISLDKDEMVLSGSEGHEIRLYRQKEKPAEKR